MVRSQFTDYKMKVNCMKSSSFVARGLMSHLDKIGGVEPRVLNPYNLPGTSSYTISLAVLGLLTITIIL